MKERLSVEWDGFWWTSAVALITFAAGEETNILTLATPGGPCSHPPIVTISIRPHRYSYELLRKNGEFVMNFPPVQMIQEMEYCGIYSGREVDKWENCGFTPIKGEMVDVPLIAECPINVECVVEHEIRFRREDGREGSHVVVLGRILHVQCHEEYYVDGEIQWDLVDVIFRARPRTWRAVGPVIGYDLVYKREAPDDLKAGRGAFSDPRLAPDRVNERTAALADLLDLDRGRPPIAGPTKPEREPE